MQQYWHLYCSIILGSTSIVIHSMKQCPPRSANCDLLRLFVWKIMKGIHSCRPALLNCPICTIRGCVSIRGLCYIFHTINLFYLQYYLQTQVVMASSFLFFCLKKKSFVNTSKVLFSGLLMSVLLNWPMISPTNKPLPGFELTSPDGQGLVLKVGYFPWCTSCCERIDCEQIIYCLCHRRITCCSCYITCCLCVFNLMFHITGLG